MRRTKDWLQKYIAYSASSEAPDIFHFWTGVSVIAGALQRKVWIDQAYFQWTPNFYIVFVAPPGIVSKSTTASIGMKLLKQLPDVKFGPDAVTWQSLVQSLAQSTQEVLMPDGLFHPMSCVTISSSEFGTFLNPNDREMVDVLVQLWDGQVSTFEKKTKTSGNDIIVNPWINILACTTPAWIAGNFPEYMIGGGFTSRTVFVYAEHKRQLIAYPKKIIPKDFEKMADDLVHDLTEIAKLKGEIELSPEAIEWGTKWYEQHYANAPKTFTDERFGGYVARKQTHLHKLAIVLMASKGDELIIRPEHLQVAEQILLANEKDMPRIFQNIAADSAKTANQVLSVIRRVQKIEMQEAFGLVFNSMGYDDFKAAINAGVQAGHLKLTNENGRQYVAAFNIT